MYSIDFNIGYDTDYCQIMIWPEGRNLKPIRQSASKKQFSGKEERKEACLKSILAARPSSAFVAEKTGFYRLSLINCGSSITDGTDKSKYYFENQGYKVIVFKKKICSSLLNTSEEWTIFSDDMGFYFSIKFFHWFFF